MKTGSKITRRHFLETTSIAGAAVSLTLPQLANASTGAPASSARSQPAIIGGVKAHPGSWPKWPVFDVTEEKQLLEALRSGQWFRYYSGAVQVAGFEDAYAKHAGAKHCIATSSGTSALYTAL